MTAVVRGTIQPIGFHLALSADWLVTAVSANIGDFIDHPADTVLGHPVTGLFSSETIHDIRNRMALLRDGDAVEHLFHFPLAVNEREFDLTIYRHCGGFGIDFEPCAERSLGDATGILQGMVSRIETSDDVPKLCDQACNRLRALTGFQQVVISVGSNRLGESARGGLTPVDPATAPLDADMVVFDCDSAAVPVEVVESGWTAPRQSPLRSPSSADVDRLRAIGARAALIVPLDRDGRGWGQAACYHDSPRQISAERRNIARLFAGIVALRIEIAELRRGR